MTRHVLVARGGALGDLILSFPLLRAMRRADPAVHLTLMAPERGGSLARAEGLVARWIRMDRPDMEEVLEGVVARSDTVCWFRADVAERARTWRRLGCTVLGGPPHPPAGVHASDHLAALAGVALLDVDRGAPAYEPGAVEVARTRLATGGIDPDQAVAIVPGSGKRGTRWPLRNYVDLATALQRRGLDAFLLAGPVEVEEGLEGPAGVPVLTEVDPVATAALLRAAGNVVGNDTGTTHLAAWVGAATLALFGPSDPGQWAPVGPQAQVLRAPGGSLVDLPVSIVLDAFIALRQRAAAATAPGTPRRP